ncbi:MAG TPA: preprotein translocase subunit YajC [Flavipsychrobacter sp.]|jgi:preprotein translocase subunit YajC|nr:preprotein translocase subunit YajC [Flavipsychrobacter sp.]
MQPNIQTVLLQAQQPSAMPSLFIMIGMVVVMYFFMIRPQAKRAKEQKKFSESVNTGEKIVTASGIHGTINRMNDDGTIQLEIARGVFIIIDKSAVSMEMTNAFRKASNITPTVVAEAK